MQLERYVGNTVTWRLTMPNARNRDWAEIKANHRPSGGYVVTWYHWTGSQRHEGISGPFAELHHAKTFSKRALLRLHARLTA
jgi:hypothetical protein